MRPSRAYRPLPPLPLEGRVVLSAASSATAQLAARASNLNITAQPVALTPAEVAQSNASDAAFGLSPSDTLRAGDSVAEQVTITYAAASPQTETVLKVPDLSNNSIATYKTMNLRNNGGTKTVVQTETFSGGSMALSGTNNAYTITTTLPNGTVETETEDEVIRGPKTVINATIQEPGGGVETWTSVNIEHGRTTVAHRTIHEPDGTVEYQTTTTRARGDLDSTAVTTTRIPAKDEIVYSSSATNVIRVQPPAG